MAVKIKLLRCSICGLRYKDKKWAEKCKVWCQKHKSCNLEITKHAINPVRKIASQAS